MDEQVKVWKERGWFEYDWVADAAWVERLNAEPKVLFRAAWDWVDISKQLLTHRYGQDDCDRAIDGIPTPPTFYSHLTDLLVVWCDTCCPAIDAEPFLEFSMYACNDQVFLSSEDVPADKSDDVEPVWLWHPNSPRWFLWKPDRFKVIRALERAELSAMRVQLLAEYRAGTSLDVLDHDEKDILDLLRRVGRRLSTTKLLDQFANDGEIKSEGTIKPKLARLVSRRKLTNTKDERGQGYGLPEWG